MDADPRLRPVAPADWPAIEAALARVEEPTCDLALASLVIWRDCEALLLGSTPEGACLVVAPHHEPAYVLEPLAPPDDDDARAKALESCVRAFGRASRVRESLAARVSRDELDVVVLPDHFDYLYETAALAELRGSKHDGQRNQIRRLAREHPRHEIRQLCAQDRDAALAVFDRWSAAHDEPGAGGGARTPARDCQRRAIERAFDDFARLGLAGGVIAEEGVVRAFLLASVAGRVADVHFLHAEPGLHGAYQALLRECCRGALAGTELVNLEEDLGLPGLRRAKLSYGPARIARKFEIVPRVPGAADRRP